MSQINWIRVLIGGLVWCLAYNLLTGAAWYAFLSSVGIPSMHPVLGHGGPLFGPDGPPGSYLLLTLVMGIFAAWFYAALRPRYGVAPVTAAYAGVALWLIWGLFPVLAPDLQTLFAGAMLVELFSKLLVIALASQGAAWIYRDKSQAVAADVIR